MIDRKLLLQSAELYSRLEIDFLPDQGGKNGPISYLLDRARGDAIEAVGDLLQIDADLPDSEIASQFRKNVAALDRYSDLIRYVREAVDAGKEAEPQLDEEDQESILQAIGIIEADA